MKNYKIIGFMGKYNVTCQDGIIYPSYLIRGTDGEVVTFTSNYAARKFIETLPRESDPEPEAESEDTVEDTVKDEAII